MKPRLFYEKQARDLIKRAREEKQLTYAQLAELLKAHGAVLEERALINVGAGAKVLSFGRFQNAEGIASAFA